MKRIQQVLSESDIEEEGSDSDIEEEDSSTPQMLYVWHSPTPWQMYMEIVAKYH